MSEDLYEELLLVKIGMFYFSSNVLTIGCFCGVAGTSPGFHFWVDSYCLITRSDETAVIFVVIQVLLCAYCNQYQIPLV